MRATRWFAGVAGASLLFGCGPTEGDDPKKEPDFLPITGKSAALRANANIADHLDGLASVILVLEDSKLLGDILPRETEEPVPPCPVGQICDTPEEPSAFDLTDEAGEIKKWLADNVFNEAAVESSTETSVTYRLRPEAVCPEREKEGGGTERDPDCVKVLTELPVRIAVTSRTEGDLDLELTVGTRNPVDVELYVARIAATADLAAVKAVVSDVAGVLGEEVPGFPERFVGKVQVAVVKNAAQDYTAKLSVIENVNVGNAADTSREHFDVKVAAATDALTLRLTAGTKTALASLGFKAIDLAAALDLVAGGSGESICEWNEETQMEECTTTEPDPKDGLLALHLGGVNAAGTFTVENDTLSLTGLGLGDETSTVKYNGTQILALDINKAAGRRFDLTVADAEGGPVVKVKPSLSVEVAHNLTPLADELGDDLPDFLKGGSSSVTFDGAAEPTLKIREEGGNAPVKVVAGKLTLAATGITPVVVSAPACLVEIEGGEEETQHPFQSVASGACE